MAVNEHGDAEKDARLARLYREAAREEPPAHFDRAIMAAAREAAAPPTRARERSSWWWTPWRLPFAFAALAVVSVSLVTLMKEHDPERVASVPPPAAYEREQAKTEQQSAPPAASLPAPMKEPHVRPQQRGAGPPPVPENAVTSSSRSEVAGAETSAPFADAPRARQKAPAADAAAQGAVDGLAAAAPRSAGESEARRSEDRALAAPAPAPMARSAPASPIEPAPAERPAAAPAARPAPAPKASIGVRGLESDGYAREARASVAVSRQVAELEGKPLGAWVERVLTLRREGRTAEADGLLAEVRRRFPGEPLPAELQ